MLTRLKRKVGRFLKPRKEPAPGPVAAPDFRLPKGLQYHRFLQAVHERHLFDWYLEIGCRYGTSFAPVRSRTIAVDPFFQTAINVIGAKPELHVFQKTSDDFFASDFLSRSVARLSFSFLDGMHLIEYVLRDFANAEAASRPAGIIAIHDVVPMNHQMTTRDLTVLDSLPGKAWTGDVWKVVPILQRWRPDLTLTILDCASTGLLLISGLKPENTILRGSTDTILLEFRDTDLEAWGTERFFNSFDYTSAADFLKARSDFWTPASLRETTGIVPRRVSI